MSVAFTSEPELKWDIAVLVGESGSSRSNLHPIAEFFLKRLKLAIMERCVSPEFITIEYFRYYICGIRYIQKN